MLGSFARLRGIRPAVALAAMALPVMIVASGCGAARPGAAAVVGGDRIDISQVHARTERTINEAGSVNSQTDPATIQRTQLTALITHELLLQAAKMRGITVSSGEVDSYMAQLIQNYGDEEQLYAAAAQGGVAKEDVWQVVEDQLLEIRLGQSIAGNTPVDQMKVEHILVKDQATADKLAAEIRKDPGSFTKLAKENSLDASTKDSGGDLGYQSPSALPQQVQDAGVGDVVVVQASDGWHVVRVDDRRSIPLSQLPPDDPAAVQHAQLAAIDYLVKVARDVGVSVNPRFGIWDAKQLTVGAPSDALSSPAASPGQTPGQPSGQLPAPSATP